MLPHILILSLRKRLVDPIDTRKVHSVPASRLGGVTFFPAILFASWFCISIAMLIKSHFTIELGFGYDFVISVKMILEILALLLLFLIGVYDDVIGVSPGKKFIVQIFAAILIAASGTYFKTLHGFCGVHEITPYIGIPLSILFFVFVTNAINLIDGIDGLASLLSIMALIVYSILLYNNDMMTDCLVAVSTLGALIPFCYRNVFGIKRSAKSKIFMGDTGALVIGAILGFTTVSLWNTSINVDSGAPISQTFYTMAYTMLLIPCLDVVRIVIRRYRNNRPLFKPDKIHFHHKLMALGLTPHWALMFIIVINLIFVGVNIILAPMINITFIFITDIIIWVTLHVIITKKINSKTPGLKWGKK